MSTFAWIGAILVNVGFVVLISWGASLYWPVGFVLSGLYTAALLGLASCLEQWNHRGMGGLSSFRRPQQQQPPQQVMDRSYQNGNHATTTTTTDEDDDVEEQQQQQEQVAVQVGSTTTTTTTTTAQQEEQQEPLLLLSPQAVEDASGMATIQSLLYGLGVIALGVTGFFLPINLMGCNGSDDTGTEYSQWKVDDISSFPSSIQEWARDDYQEVQQRPSYCYLNQTGTTLFAGHGQRDQTSPSWNILYSVETTTTTTTNPSTDGNSFWGAAPVPYDTVTEPELFTTLNNEAACFTNLAWSNGRPAVGCYYPNNNHNNNNDPIQWPQYPTKMAHMRVNDVYTMVAAARSPRHEELLYWKQLPRGRRERGTIVLSMSVKTMNVVLHSHRETPHHNDDHGDSSCDPRRDARQKAIGSLFLTALPMLLTSLYVWKAKQQVSSMGVLVYGSLTLAFTCIYAAVDPDMYRAETVFQWWLIGSGSIVLLLSVRTLLLYGGLANNNNNNSTTPRRHSTLPPTPPSQRWIVPGPFHWCASASALALLLGLIVALDLLCTTTTCGNVPSHWFVFSIAGVIPVALLGTAVNNLFLMLLAAAGFFADAVRFAAFLSDNAAPNDLQVPIVFVVLSISGVLLGWLGMLLSRQRRRIQSRITMLFQMLDRVVFYLIVCCRRSSRTSANQPDDEVSPTDSHEEMEDEIET